MISFNASEWQGLETLAEDELKALRPKAETMMLKGALRFEEELKKTLTGGRSGETYLTGKYFDRSHVASAPGEPPAVLTGALRNSMGHTRPKWEGWTISFEAGSGLGKGDPAAAYARRLEFGGVSVVPRDVNVRFPDGWRRVKAGTVIKIEPRPYMAPTAERMDPILQRMFEAGL